MLSETVVPKSPKMPMIKIGRTSVKIVANPAGKNAKSNTATLGREADKTSAKGDMAIPAIARTFFIKPSLVWIEIESRTAVYIRPEVLSRNIFKAL